MKSIVQNKKECIACSAFLRLYNPSVELHHVYYGKNRRTSDINGFTVWLCPEHHRGTYGVHGKKGHELDSWLKKLTQATCEAEGYTREEFIKLVGKNYLD